MKNKKVIGVLVGILGAIIMVGAGFGIYKLNSGKTEKETEKDAVYVSDEIVKTDKNAEYKEITKELEGIDVLYVTEAIKNNDDTYTLKGVIYTQKTFTNEEVENAMKKGIFTFEGEDYIIEEENGRYNLYPKSKEYICASLIIKDLDKYYIETATDISHNWMKTNEYRKITVNSDLKCEDAYTEEVTTVKENFKDYKKVEPEDSTHPNNDRTYTFEFKDGKCVKVVNTTTSK